MSTKPVETLDSVIDSVGRFFIDDATDVFIESTLEVAEQLRSVHETDNHQHFETCRDLFRVGRSNWLEDLVTLIHRYAEKFVQIAISCPALVSGDPVTWIRLHLNALLSSHLRQELNLEALAEQAIQRRLARREAVRSGIDPATLESKSARPPNYSKVGAWFRYVADHPDFDCSESGFHEP
jgi:hypothetical protein